jgi:hypothetical protein
MDYIKSPESTQKENSTEIKESQARVSAIWFKSRVSAIYFDISSSLELRFLRRPSCFFLFLRNRRESVMKKIVVVAIFLMVSLNLQVHLARSESKGIAGAAEAAAHKDDDDASSFGSGSDDTAMVLLHNGYVYTPRFLGKAHVLLAGGSVAAIFKEGDFPLANFSGLPCLKTIDVEEGFVVPGLIDMHVHVTGGGGEMGPASRTPEGKISELLEAGITTVVGILGTDCVSRR